MDKKSISLVFFLVCNSLMAQTEIQDTPIWEDRSLWIKIISVLTGAIFSAIATYIFIQYKERRNQRRISYDIKIVRGLVKIDDKIKGSTEIKYKNIDTKKLSLVECDFLNSGKKLVKDLLIRFNAEGKDISIIEHFFDPIPLPEYEINQDYEYGKNNDIIRYKIGHLPMNQRVNVRFIVSGELTKFDIIHKSNDEDIKLITQSLTKEESEEEIVSAFITFLILIIFYIPALTNSLSIIFGSIQQSFKAIFTLIVLLVFIPILKKSTRILAEILVSLKNNKKGISIENIHMENDGKIHINE